MEPPGPVAGALAAAHHRGRLESVGLELPRNRVSTKTVLAGCAPLAGIDLEGFTGIRARRVCSDGEDSYTLAVDAACDCLAHSRHAPEDIEMLISCSITKFKGGRGFQFDPPLSLSIKDAIGADRAIHFDVSNACAGMLTGVAILESFIRNGSIRCGMVVSGEYVTSLSDNAVRSIESLTDKQVASLTLGDCGAAVIVDRAPEDSSGIVACEFATLAEYSDLCIGKASKVGPGGAMFTDMTAIQDVSVDHASPMIRRALDASGLRFDQIDYVIPHQTSVRAIRRGHKRAVRELGAPGPRHVVENLAEYGNTASTTHFLALYEGLNAGRFESDDRIMLLCFASGIVLGAIIFVVGELGGNHGRCDSGAGRPTP